VARSCTRQYGRAKCTMLQAITWRRNLEVCSEYKLKSEANCYVSLEPDGRCLKPHQVGIFITPFCFAYVMRLCIMHIIVYFINTRCIALEFLGPILLQLNRILCLDSQFHLCRKKVAYKVINEFCIQCIFLSGFFL
jgi:hypothetical protein